MSTVEQKVPTEFSMLCGCVLHGIWLGRLVMFFHDAETAGAQNGMPRFIECRQRRYQWSRGGLQQTEA